MEIRMDTPRELARDIGKVLREVDSPQNRVTNLGEQSLRFVQMLPFNNQSLAPQRDTYIVRIIELVTR